MTDYILVNFTYLGNQRLPLKEKKDNRETGVKF